nr:hypothetical protein CFP56_73943 [Quercus suber]
MSSIGEGRMRAGNLRPPSTGSGRNDETQCFQRASAPSRYRVVVGSNRLFERRTGRPRAVARRSDQISVEGRRVVAKSSAMRCTRGNEADKDSLRRDRSRRMKSSRWSYRRNEGLTNDGAGHCKRGLLACWPAFCFHCFCCFRGALLSYGSPRSQRSAHKDEAGPKPVLPRFDHQPDDQIYPHFLNSDSES